MPDKRRFFSSSVRLDGFMDVLILLALAGSWLGLLGSWHWALDLFSHFRWQYLAACVAAVIWTVLRKRRWVTLISVVTLLLNGWLVGHLMIGTGEGRVPRDQCLRVVSLNVLTSNLNKERVLAYLRGVDADVIFLMEVNAEWMRALELLKESHPQCLVEPREDNFGVAMFSRLPLETVKLVDLGEAGVPSIEARLKYRERDMVILGTHPLPPTGAVYAAERDSQLRSVAAHVAGLSMPALVIGDLNSTPWSHGMRLIKADGKLDLGSASNVAMPTWKVGTVLAIPIDHALCSAPLRITRKTVAPDVGSDHRPLEVEVRWAPK
ncbi:MAG: endonuclease/exonuclease/phosphatase family protein [Prosthecobacter sp.]|nr:endonuclease/exonuclease/phosphatase family protein [Prosthecobacter sp.]